MAEIEFIEPGVEISRTSQRRRGGWPTWAQGRRLTSVSWLAAAALAVASSFLDVYHSSVSLPSTGRARVGYQYGADGWGREYFQSFNFSGLQLDFGKGPRFGIILVACAVLMLTAFGFLATERESTRALGGLLSTASSGALLATAAAMLLSVQAAITLGGPEVKVTTVLGPCAWCTAVAGLLAPAGYIVDRLRQCVHRKVNWCWRQNG